MPLSVGGRLGPYEILALIGAGGMGEVYRARDTKLKRDVAVKVLPEVFARDVDRMGRFQREAELLASLNHPNIAHIYGVEENALVMELVGGNTLGSGLPVETALRYAKQIAEALEYAHERGVMHRDLKPANIKVTPEGNVKLLDFGLAKAVEDAPKPSLDPTNSPTLTLGSTRMGVILGTAAYMSPEQASGVASDRRTDVWAFGAVLYEMLAGRQAFGGESASDTLATVLKLDPDWKALPKDTPPSIVTLLRRCLTKDRRKRLQVISEARIALEDPGSTQPAEAAGPTRPSASRLNTAAWVAAGVFAVVAAVALWGWLKPAPAKPIIRFSTPIPAGAAVPNVVLSRDGSTVAWSGGPGKPIYIRRLDELEPRPLAGTDGATGFAFSPDGQWMVYNGPSDNAVRPLKKAPIAGGAALTLAEGLNIINGIDWGLDDNIYFTTLQDLYRVPANGGKPQTLFSVDSKKGEIQAIDPQLLPGGKEVLISVLGTKGFLSADSIAVNVQSRERKTVMEGGGFGRYVETGKPGLWGKGSGYLVYGLNGALLAVSLDLNTLKAGSPVPMLGGVMGLGPGVFFGLSDSGTLAYVPGAASDVAGGLAATLTWVDRTGAEQAIPAAPRLYGNFQLSPDNSRIAADALDLQRVIPDIWIYDITRGTQPKVTFEGSNGSPLWTPDGKRIIYSTSRDLMGQQEPGIRSVPADSSGPPVTLLSSEAPAYRPSAVSPDGKLLIGVRNKANSQPSISSAGDTIWVLPIEGGAPEQAKSSQAKPQTFLESPFTKLVPEFSPDGKLVAYQSDDTGRNEIYVVPYPDKAWKQQVSTDGGTLPRWSHDGRELFYRSGNKMMAVDIQLTPAFKVTGTPKMLFEKAANLIVGSGYDVSRDGKRFLMLKLNTPPGQSSQVNVVVNWAEDLRRRAPGK